MVSHRALCVEFDLFLVSASYEFVIVHGINKPSVNCDRNRKTRPGIVEVHPCATSAGLTLHTYAKNCRRPARGRTTGRTTGDHRLECEGEKDLIGKKSGPPAKRFANSVRDEGSILSANVARTAAVLSIKIVLHTISHSVLKTIHLLRMRGTRGQVRQKHARTYAAPSVLFENWRYLLVSVVVSSFIQRTQLGRLLIPTTL